MLQTKPGYALLGDGAYLMSPFAGEGANLAMIDAADLARAIIDHPDDIERAFDVYEPVMVARAEKSAAVSASNLELAFEENAPRACWICLQVMDSDRGLRRGKARSVDCDASADDGAAGSRMG